MSVRQRGRRWQVDIYRDGRRFRRSFPNKKHAMAWEGKIRTAAIEGRLFDVKREAFNTFNDLLNWYLDLPEVKAKKSYDKDHHWARGLREYFGEMRVDRITPEHVEGFIQHKLNSRTLHRGNFKPATVNRHLALFKSVYNKAARNGKTHANPSKAVRMCKGEVQRNRVLTAAEWEAYHAAAAPWFRPVALCAYVSAMRAAEIAGLRWDQVDRKAGFIRLRPGETKSGEGRSVPIDPRLDAALDALPRSIQRDGLVFTREGRHIGHAIHPAHKRACEDAGIEGFWFHDFRHSCITNWRRRGVDYMTIMQATGHKTLVMFQRYNSFCEEDLKALVGPVPASNCHKIVTEAQ